MRNLPRPPPQDEPEQEPSRKDIAASLAQKDPTWFRQTQDRGTGSAAFRKNQVEDSPEPLQSTSMRLPGMSQAREPSKSPTPEARAEREPPRNPIDLDRFKRGNTPDIVALRDSMIMDKSPARLQQEPANSRPVSVDNETSDSSAPSLARTSSVLSSNRPVSPTKGLGGFVESAMMRRSDSVSKRWSVKNTGLKRGDSVSVAGGRPTSLHSRGLSRDVHSGREASPSSPLASSRPSSSQGRDHLASAVIGEKSASVEPPEILAASFDNTQNPPDVEVDDAQLGRSPSKTMDPRRWSPTKSTWLESALQAESPKPPPLKEEQPKWKVDLQRSRSRAGRDVSPEKRNSKQEPEPAPSKASLSSKPQPQGATETEPTVSTPSTEVASVDDLPQQNSKPLIKQKPRIVSSNQDNQKEAPKSDVQIAEEPQQAQVIEPTETAKKPPELKPKPQTPPKTDFRSTLKSRGTGPSQSTEAEPEFKSMFGKLKRATTQNYVAPDELKNNILSGKAALNVTGGPQKTKRVDEFKESILAKKEAMKAASSNPVPRSESPTKEEAPIPEALARRKTLSKASAPNLNFAKDVPRSTTPTPAPKPTTAPKPSTTETAGSRKVEPAAPAIPVKKITSVERDAKPLSKQAQVAQERSIPVEGVAKTSAPPVQEAKSPPLVQSVKLKPSDTPSWTTRPTVTSPPAKDNRSEESASKAELSVGSKLASRLNPNLAAMLARGSSPRPQVSRDASSDDVTTTQSSIPVTSRKEDESAGSLTHMTKARAKGPKRRAPKVEATPSAKDNRSKPASQVPAIERSTPMKIAADEPTGPNGSTTAQEPPQKPSMVLRELPQPRAVSVGQPQAKSQTAESKTAPQVEEPEIDVPKSKPVIASKSPELRKVSSSSGLDETLRASPKPSPATKPTWPPVTKATRAEKAPVADIAQSKFPAIPVKSNLVPTKSRDGGTMSQTKDVPPISSSTKPVAIQGLGLTASPTPASRKPIVQPRTFTPPVAKEKAQISMLPQEIKAIIENYVGPILKDYEKADFDSQRFLLDAKNSEQRIKTANYTINEVTGDGKKVPMPPQQEHILYEECMYLITHTFSANDTSTSEVYLWSGDRVPDASIEDAQVFCRRDAREHNTKLEVVKQGKESTRLLQALGGILIIRRTKNSSLYMLCGRRHLGHIVFDEVEMESENLCPGYTYLISAQYGKLYLWKGKGAGADEIGSARLIGMDLGLTGEIEEVDEGAEPSRFWNVFGSKTLGQWSPDWAKRTELNGYPTVMYRVEHERPGLLGNLWGLTRAASPSKGQQVKASCERLESFSQSDLEAASVHIIDAYRSIYVVVTRQCSSKAAELVTALHLAQDLAMLSPATQDRPLLPTCYVIAGDLPSDAKACFRKWSALQAHSIVKKESICVPLEEIMDALEL